MSVANNHACCMSLVYHWLASTGMLCIVLNASLRLLHLQCSDSK